MRRSRHILLSLLLNRFFLHLMFPPFSIPIPLILHTSHSLAYKPVAKKVRLVLAPLEEEYRVLRRPVT